jgi:hypothetical protein
MSTQRYISTSFWDDEWIHKLDPSEKLLYMYFMTNTLTNIAGVYKIAVERISYDTGFNENTIQHIFEKFENCGKVHRRGEYIAIPSWPKHQKWQSKNTIKDGIIKILNDLDDETIKWLLLIGYRFDFSLTRYPIGTIGVPYPYDTPMVPIPPDTTRGGPSYLNLNLNLNSDTDINRDAPLDPSFSVSKNGSVKSLSGSERIESARKLWNSIGCEPSCLRTVINFSPDDLTECTKTMNSFPDELIFESINNYKFIQNSSEHEITMPYGSFQGFIKNGVDKFVTSANPNERYKKHIVPKQLGKKGMITDLDDITF